MEVQKSRRNGPTNYAEYLQTPEGEIWQILEGEPMLMAPAPSEDHQRIVGNLFADLHQYLRGKDCVVRMAPYDVRLFVEDKNDEDITTVVQPDIFVVCDRNKIDKRGCKGAPDFVVEVLSQSTSHIDRGLKLHLYKKAGVREYWLIDPLNERIEVYDFIRDPENFFASALYHRETDAAISVRIFEDLTIPMTNLFA
jgi:Uma2 family endonuclease